MYVFVLNFFLAIYIFRRPFLLGYPHRIFSFFPLPLIPSLRARSAARPTPVFLPADERSDFQPPRFPSLSPPPPPSVRQRDAFAERRSKKRRRRRCQLPSPPLSHGVLLSFILLWPSPLEPPVVARLPIGEEVPPGIKGIQTETRATRNTRRGPICPNGFQEKTAASHAVQ